MPRFICSTLDGDHQLLVVNRRFCSLSPSIELIAIFIIYANSILVVRLLYSPLQLPDTSKMYHLISIYHFPPQPFLIGE